jgi:Leucine-rich repeat (LRR) protein
LEFLVVNYIPFSSLDINAFRGFENTLEILIMNYAKLEKVPHAICQLTILKNLDFKYDTNLKENDSSIIEPCGNTLLTDTDMYLHLDNNNLHNFPDVFLAFPSLTVLTAINNNFRYIDNSIIPPDAHLETIFLSNNLFERIPSALNKFKSLQNLYIDSNKIRAVESVDLYGLSNLTTLYLNDNPLAYINPDAFSHNPSLNELYLQNTQIDHVPQAVVGLSNLNELYLEGNLIDCTCEMTYLRHWNVSAVTEFSTQCASSTETIKTFVMTSLQSCPGA